MFYLLIFNLPQHTSHKKNIQEGPHTQKIHGELKTMQLPRHMVSCLHINNSSICIMNKC